MRAREFITERETVSFQGIDMSLEREEDEIMVTASAGGRPLGSVLFIDYDGELMPQDLEVDERYRGQGIAAAMYDYVKSQGYKIRRSGQQTDAGAGFWAKHRPDSNVWEQGVAEGLNEMDKSAPQPGRDGKVSHSTYGSRDKKGSDYFKGKEAPGKPVTAKQMSKDALDILKKQGVAEGGRR